MKLSEYYTAIAEARRSLAVLMADINEIDVRHTRLYGVLAGIRAMERREENEQAKKAYKLCADKIRDAMNWVG